MNTTTTLMDGLDWVERYAWFGFFVGSFSHEPSSLILTFDIAASKIGCSIQCDNLPPVLGRLLTNADCPQISWMRWVV